MSEKEIAKTVSGHRDRNRMLRAELTERNVNLEEPRPIEFHFWAWTQRDAAVLGKSLYQMGFVIRLLAPAPADNDPDRWSVEAGAKIPAIQALGDELTERLVRLAASEDAVFDGWGTSV